MRTTLCWSRYVCLWTCGGADGCAVAELVLVLNVEDVESSVDVGWSVVLTAVVEAKVELVEVAVSEETDVESVVFALSDEVESTEDVVVGEAD